MTIREWPAQERPREKLIERGAAALSDAELLAIFIGTGRRGHSAVDIGREIIAARGNLRTLLDLELRELATHAGLGLAKASRLHAALELGRRYLASELDRTDPLTNPLACANYLHSRIGAYPYEVFACLFLDIRNRVIAFEELFRGSITGAEVHTREVARRCLIHNAAAVIFAHNHPSGVAEASCADRDLTTRLRRSLEMIDVRVLDHFVIGDGKHFSFAQSGWL
ncbi:MAG TPA: DNA repair protein RadC [Rudaea sp.]|jgi:DNA repair protein RadC|nr:DNA repair protein RadC [Rudaea sp.]